MYYYIVKSLVRKSFDQVNRRQFDDLLKSVSPGVRHSFAGNHALGGVRNDSGAFKAWLERLAKVMPTLQIQIRDIKVTGWPHHTLAIVRWSAGATLQNGEPYLNHGVHFVTLKWAKVTEIEVYEDSQLVANTLQKQFDAGIREAMAAPITS